MLIGELADAVGVPTRTVRFYERRGLLPEPARAANGYRIYDDATLRRLRFIRSAQAAGLTLSEIIDIIEVRNNGEVPCTHVAELLATKLDDVRRRRQELGMLESELEQLIERSQRLDPADCGERDICHILTLDNERPPAPQVSTR
jgi:DNA-binding transcriptional MerR regulator